MFKHFIYIYYDNDIPFYVGMGHGRRHLDHIRYAKNAIDTGAHRNRLSHKLNKIIKIISEGRMPKIDIVERGLTIIQAQNREKELIAFYGRADLEKGTLTNLTDGGEGVHGRTTMVSPNGDRISILKEDKPAYEAIGYRHFNLGRKHSHETNQRKAAPWKGGTRPEHGDKIRAAAERGAYKNRPSRGAHSESTLSKMRKPKTKREGYQHRHWYHSIALCCEACINVKPTWPDVQPGRLPKSS
jgi:hypothetical protein